jgi:hypothetical protein
MGCRAARRLDELMQQLENAAGVAGDKALAGEAIGGGVWLPQLLPQPRMHALQPAAAKHRWTAHARPTPA